MDEFLGSIDLNQNGDLLVSSSYLTFANWTGFIGYLSSDELTARLQSPSQQQPLMLSSLKMSLDIKSGVSVARWSSNQGILVGTDLGEVNLYRIKNADNNQESKQFDCEMSKREHDDPITCLETRNDSNTAISGSEDSRIKVWDLNEQLSVATYEVHELGVTSLTWSPNEANMFLSTSQDEKAIIWDMRKSRPAVLIAHGLAGHPSASDWSSVDLNQITFGSETGQLGIYDLRMLALKTPFCISQVHSKLIRRVKFNARTNAIATASEDATTKVFMTVNPSVINEAGVKQVYSSYKHLDFVSDLAWKSDTSSYFTSSWDGTVQFHNFMSTKINGHRD